MTYDAETVEQYISSVPEDRRKAIVKLLDVIGANIP